MTARTCREVKFGPCPPDDRAEGLAVLYHRMSDATRSNLIVELLRQEALGLLDLSGLWAAYRKRRMIGAMLTQVLSGRAVAIWPPVVPRRWGSNAIASAMVAEVLRFHRTQGVKLAQALVDRHLSKQAGMDLERGGLPYVTDLIYLGRSTAEPIPMASDLPKLQWEGFAPNRRETFARVMERSYEGSLDMPELAGLRHLEDLLQGYLARGQFDPRRWQVGRIGGQEEPVAVLLLSEGEERTWEVSYLGLAPEARGRGLGRAVLAHALEMARPHADRLELAVDARNIPADRLYQGCGFLAFDRRGVHLAVLKVPESKGEPNQEGSTIR